MPRHGSQRNHALASHTAPTLPAGTRVRIADARTVREKLGEHWQARYYSPFCGTAQEARVVRSLGPELVYVRFQHSDGVFSCLTFPLACLIPLTAAAAPSPCFPSPFELRHSQELQRIRAGPERSFTQPLANRQVVHSVESVPLSERSIRPRSFSGRGHVDASGGMDARDPPPAAAATRMTRAMTMPIHGNPRQVQPHPPCVVCGRTDRAGEMRKSGFKCAECVGRFSSVITRKFSQMLRR